MSLSPLANTPFLLCCTGTHTYPNSLGLGLLHFLLIPLSSFDCVLSVILGRSRRGHLRFVVAVRLRGTKTVVTL